MFSNLGACLCAIVVAQTPVDCGKGSNGINIALHKPTNQSSTYTDIAAVGWFLFKRDIVGTSDKAVDGGESNRFEDETCSHTAIDVGVDLDPWWEVDLQRDYIIDKVRILNRNVCDKRLHDFKIDVFRNYPHHYTKHCVTHKGPAGPGWLALTCESHVTGRFVRISKPKLDSGDPLTLCEVEIYGTPSVRVSKGCRSKVFRRISNTSLQPSTVSLNVHSITHCAIICLKTGESAFLIVREEEDGIIRCQKAVHVFGKRDNQKMAMLCPLSYLVEIVY